MATRLSSALALVAAVIALSTLQPPATAQSQVLRPQVHLEQHPDLAREVWPADLNGDGITDLVAGTGFSGASDIVAQLGRGDGTFEASYVIGAGLFSPVGVGDVDGDGEIDVLAMNEEPFLTPATYYILRGRGDGTFDPPLQTSARLGPPVQVLDMNSDGRMDLVASVDNGIFIYPGLGNFTFAAPVVLMPIGFMKESQIVVDLNADGLPDIAAVTKDAATLDIFFSNGGLEFTRVTTALPQDGGGISARDMNGDGIVDLVIGTGSWSFTNGTWSSGFVSVLLGTGGGAFLEPLVFPTAPGPVRVVIGDFDGDGIPDVATGNRSTAARCEGINYLWDSVSILHGVGDGTLRPAASFALGDSEEHTDSLYRTLHRLNTSDLNGDGRTDLIASPGAILLSLPSGPNRPPIANAGHDRVEPYDAAGNVSLFGSATDPDHDWLTWEWRDSEGTVIGDVARQCLRTTGPYSGTETFTLTVRDAYGGESTDSMIWTFAVTPPPLPSGWTADTIGDAFGRTFPVGDSFSVTARGADIWGTSDAFEFAHQSVTGDFTITAQVTDVQNIHPWTKAGLMIRGSLSPDSHHAFVLATPTTVNGVAFQRRLFDGDVSIHTPGPSIAAPVWLRLQRQGDVVTAYARSSDAEPWSEVGSQAFVQLSQSVFVGLAVTSHEADRLASATFEQVQITTASTPPTLPPGWSAVDVGSVSAPGGTLHDEGLFALAGSGADIWGTQDAFQYAYTPLSGDGVAVVRVLDLEGPHEWAKAGLMIRHSLDPAAVHHYLLMSESHGLAYQRRPVAGARSEHTPLDGPAGPVWFRIERTGETVRLWYSTGASAPGTWHFIADAFFPAGEALVGLAVTSHADGEIATAGFDRVSVTTDGPSASLTGQDIGAVGVAGHDSFAGGVHSISASGHDVWGDIDAFRYVSRELAGDGTIVARVVSFAGPHPWAKAGVMIRSSADPAATHAFMMVSRDHGLGFQRRTSSGDYSTHTEGPAVAAPQWVRLTRSGNQVTGAYSYDGSTWVTVGSDTVVLGAGPVLVGIAVTSHDNAALAHATFTGVSVTP